MKSVVANKLEAYKILLTVEKVSLFTFPISVMVSHWTLTPRTVVRIHHREPAVRVTALSLTAQALSRRQKRLGAAFSSSSMVELSTVNRVVTSSNLV